MYEVKLFNFLCFLINYLSNTNSLNVKKKLNIGIIISDKSYLDILKNRHPL